MGESTGPLDAYRWQKNGTWFACEKWGKRLTTGLSPEEVARRLRQSIVDELGVLRISWIDLPHDPTVLAPREFCFEALRHLLSTGKVSAQQLADAVETAFEKRRDGFVASYEHDRAFDEVQELLLARGLLSQKELAQSHARHSGLPYLDELPGFPLPERPAHTGLIPLIRPKRVGCGRVVSLGETEDAYHCAVFDPTEHCGAWSEALSIELLQFLLGTTQAQPKRLALVVARRETIARAQAEILAEETAPDWGIGNVHLGDTRSQVDQRLGVVPERVSATVLRYPTDPPVTVVYHKDRLVVGVTGDVLEYRGEPICRAEDPLVRLIDRVGTPSGDTYPGGGEKLQYWQVHLMVSSVDTGVYTMETGRVMRVASFQLGAAPGQYYNPFAAEAGEKRLASIQRLQFGCPDVPWRNAGVWAKKYLSH